MTGEPESRIRFEALTARHDRAGFRCGVPALDRYLSAQASQDVRRRMASCFVAAEGFQVLGFYTLAAASIALVDLSAETRARLPRYPSIPAALIGRLAVAEGARGRGLGGAMLMNAVERLLQSELAAYALVVEAKDDAAVAFYRHHGFTAFDSRPRSMLLPVATGARSLNPGSAR